MMYRTTSYDIQNWDVFWYEKNLQGDIVAVYNSSGLKLVTYTYDAWGNQTVKYWNGGGSTAAQYNPFRYRGYYYDTDLRMYYLQSRYYDAKICRFINADVYISTGYGLIGNNMFAYCNNNPVCYSDHEGKNFTYTCDYDEGYSLNGWWLEGRGAGGTNCGGSYFGLGTAYHNYAVYSNTAAHDAYLGGYYYGGGGYVGGYTSQFVTGRVTVTDSMATSISQSSNRFLPDNYYTNNEAPRFSTPNSSNYTVKYNDYTEKFEISSTYYDYAGRQIIRIDWTNHGRADHGNPHIHFRTYSNTYPDGFKWRLD